MIPPFWGLGLQTIFNLIANEATGRRLIHKEKSGVDEDKGGSETEAEGCLRSR